MKNTKKRKKRISTFSIIMFTLFLLLPKAIWSSVKFPETPAGKRAREVFDLLNNESSYDMEDYMKKNYTPSFLNSFPLATHKSIYEVTRTMFGKLNLVYISKSTPEEFSATLRSESRDAWLNLLVQVESGKPHRISMLGLRPGAPPENPARRFPPPGPATPPPAFHLSCRATPIRKSQRSAF